MPIKLQANVLLKNFTTFKIGGPAKYFISVKTIQNALSALRFAKKNQLKYLVIGNGSNILFDSKGFNGVVILNRIDHLIIEKNKITVGAGYKYPLLASKALKEGLSGLEFAANIPATVGGGVFMNAGANGYQTSDCLERITFLTDNLELEILEKSELNYSYRRSDLQTKKGIILEAIFMLEQKLHGKDLRKKLTDYRMKTQPNANNCAGCIFKNPKKDISAGFLIENCNLKEKRVKGAIVSSKHANFIINDNSATSDDVLTLIKHIKDIVEEKTGYLLKEEVRYIPYGE